MLLYDLQLLAVARRRLRATRLLRAAGLRDADAIAADLPAPVLRAAPRAAALDVQQRIERAGGAAHVVQVGESLVAAHAEHPLTTPAVWLRRVGCTLELRRGLLGAPGPTTARRHRCGLVAQRALRDETRALQRAGYALFDDDAGVFDAIDDGRAEAPRARLGDAALRVRADALLEAGDPRGELAALCDAISAGPPQRRAQLEGAFDALLSRYAKAFLSDLSRYPRQLELRWHLGLLDSVRVRSEASARHDEPPIDGHSARALVRRLARLPLAKQLRELSLEGPATPSFVEALAASSRAPATLESLTLRHGYGGWLGDVGRLARRLPALRRLDLQGAARLANLAGPELREFTLRTHALHPTTLAQVTGAYLPQLERLELWLLPAERWPLDLDALAPLLAGRSAPRLRHLVVAHCPRTPELMRRLADSPLLQMLDSLHVSGAAPVDRDGEWLCGYARRFDNLRELRLDKAFVSRRALDELPRRLRPRLTVVRGGSAAMSMRPPWVSWRHIERLAGALAAPAHVEAPTLL